MARKKIGLIGAGNIGGELANLAATKQLGDVVYVELPKVGATFNTHQSFGSVESVKAVSELFMPVSGKVTEVNSAIAEAPETLNSDPYGKGWLLRIQIQNAAELSTLLSSRMYEEYVTTQG